VAGRGFHFHPGHSSLVIYQRPEQHFPLPTPSCGQARIFRLGSEAITGRLKPYRDR
jgi:hypothetical protein